MTRLSGEERRKVILEAAEGLFAKRGFRGTTTAAIADAAGITEPILYRHFKSKLGLFHVLLREISGDTMREWERMTSDMGNPMAKIGAIAASFPKVGKMFEKHYKVMLAAITELSDATTRGILKKHFESYVTFISDILSESDTFMKSGLDPRFSAFHLIHLASGYAVMDPLGIVTTKGQEYIEHAIRFIGQAMMGAEPGPSEGS